LHQGHSPSGEQKIWLTQVTAIEAFFLYWANDVICQASLWKWIWQTSWRQQYYLSCCAQVLQQIHPDCAERFKCTGKLIFMQAFLGMATFFSQHWKTPSKPCVQVQAIGLQVLKTMTQRSTNIEDSSFFIFFSGELVTEIFHIIHTSLKVLLLVAN